MRRVFVWRRQMRPHHVNIPGTHEESWRLYWCWMLHFLEQGFSSGLFFSHVAPPLKNSGAPQGGRAPQFENHCIRQLVIVYFKLDTYLVLLFKVLPLLRSLLPGHFPLHPHYFQIKPTSQPTYSITTQTFSGLLSSTQKYQSRKQTQEWKDWTT